ncbi:hypothetical protein G7Y89_g1332 [Cudoniella acicularis]|uniref:Uncharacterized protein n=1 Tax=Cudoniella acicularis TaxID=354080 RepID=A0A8H4RVH8_9HELO|nr:hypothetical protein G7Y89_g1332 [Cudoniella acicularis]
MLRLLLLLTTPFLPFTHPTQVIMHSITREKPSFPASYELFSSAFKQPDPPLVKAEFKCNWQQHAWSSSFSRISSGYLYHSPTHSKVRVDATYDSSIVSSLFDYTNTSRDNLVWNTLYTIEPSVSATPKIWTGFVKPAWALFKEDILVKSNAVFAGVVDDRWLGAAASWKTVYENSGPVTVYLDSSGTFVGYDFYDVTTRTGIVNRFFNIELGKIDKRVFDFPKKE